MYLDVQILEADRQIRRLKKVLRALLLQRERRQMVNAYARKFAPEFRQIAIDAKWPSRRRWTCALPPGGLRAVQKP